MSALVLVGMSVTDVDRRDLLMVAAARLDATVAFLQMGDPSLSRELTRWADQGVETVRLIGIDQGPLAPAHSWLRRIAGHWWRERAGHRPLIEVGTRLVKSVDDLDATLLDYKPITGTELGLTSPAWEDVSRHQRQVLLCRGPRCTASGSEDTMRGLIFGLVDAGLGDDDVLVTHTGCQFPCNQAPVVSVQPDDVWYGRVDDATARAIVTEHLAGGVPVESHRLSRRRTCIPPDSPDR